MGKDHTDNSPDGRGKRPSDPNQLARWIVEQVADDEGEQPQKRKDVDHDQAFEDGPNTPSDGDNHGSGP